MLVVNILNIFTLETGKKAFVLAFFILICIYMQTGISIFQIIF